LKKKLKKCDSRGTAQSENHRPNDNILRRFSLAAFQDLREK
jgi:hypothetical protein